MGFQLRRLPRMLILFACVSALAIGPVIAEEGASSPLRFNVEVAPNTSGALEGSASLYYRWMRWLESGLEFQASGYSESYAESDGTQATVLRDVKNVDLNVLRLPVGALALRLGATETSVGCGIVANGVLADEDRFTVAGDGADTELSRLSQRAYWLKPLLAADLEFKAGPVKLGGYFRTSWPLELKERTVGSLYRTGRDAQSFDLQDIGYETRAGGELAVRLGGDWEIAAAGAWKRHLGYAVEAVGGTSYVYEAVSLEASATLLFPVGKQRVILGAAFVDDVFKPLSLYSVTPYDNMRVRVIVGTELR